LTTSETVLGAARVIFVTEIEPLNVAVLGVGLLEPPPPPQAPITSVEIKVKDKRNDFITDPLKISFTPSCHARADGHPGFPLLDSRLRGNDR
jgi:hypothetical protein